MTLRVHIWMNFPSHHQSGFFSALIDAGVDLKVTYYSAVSTARVALGWNTDQSLQSWERTLNGAHEGAYLRMLELADHIHVIPGYGSALLRLLVKTASARGINWCHWSEASHPGLRWLASYPRKSWLARKINAHALGAFAQGDMARHDFLRWGMRAEKIANLFYAIPQPHQITAPDARIVRFAAGRPTFLFLGQLISRKAVDIQLEAFAALGPVNWCLIFVGNGEVDKYRQQAERLGISERVLFLPAVKTINAPAVLSATDVLLLPSRFDGWGVVLNEAAAQGKALIASTTSGASWHLVEPGVNGYVVTPGSVRSLVGAMQNYVTGGIDQAHAHGEKSLNIVESFTCEAAANRMISVLSSWHN